MHASTHLVRRRGVVHINGCSRAVHGAAPWYGAEGATREAVKAMGQRARYRWCVDCRPLESLPTDTNGSSS